ncbi:Mitogen-activated protein kinase kinase 7 [Dichanthelium oligosanthes]|uniref:Mitogen-activated protein kinase kinase 7 n=1 Tax=Dichanthelium oligosanthes TaxID=888268 RepID=A0A1E5V4G6_9POAL|nr:Mitogen-activated protein kinase kinase 7 [Dichanthelium oligosanthes]
MVVPAAADFPLQSSGGAAVSSRGSTARPAFPIAPHEFFHRIPAAPREIVRKAAAAAEAGELRLSDLESVCHLGEGACGVVTKVRHRRTGTVFALKTAHYAGPSGAADEEAEALRRSAGSPHVVRCHAVLDGGAADAPAYVLELMDAGTLGGLLGRRGGRGIPERALAEVAARCLQGLAHVHSRGVAHLDLRPDNLLANSIGDVKIGDFSVSRILYGRAGEHRRVSVAVGSPMYLSPERFEPDAHAGPRGAIAADIWGFGVTVLELFLGRCPFLPAGVRLSFQKLRQAICDGEPPSAPEGSAASPELRGFVAACLQKDPRQRATVTQLLAHPFVAGRHVDESRCALRELIVETLEELSRELY